MPGSPRPPSRQRRTDDLRVRPGNRLEKLQGERAGQHSIRINDQWRIRFRWQNGDAPLALSQYRLAHDVSVPPRRINEIVHGTRAITADTALRLARFFGTTERFWLNLQARYDLETQRDALGARLAREVRIFERAS